MRDYNQMIGSLPGKNSTSGEGDLFREKVNWGKEAEGQGISAHQPRNVSGPRIELHNISVLGSS